MRIDELHELRDATPFRPFSINLADGRAIPVIHRDFVMSSPNGLIAIVYQSDSSFDVLDVAMITSLRVKSSNGRASHKN